jgi:hypothetical protein
MVSSKSRIIGAAELMMMYYSLAKREKKQSWSILIESALSSERGN